MNTGILGTIGIFLLAVAALLKAILGFVAGDFTGTLGFIKGLSFILIGAGLLMWAIGELHGRRGKKD